MSIGKIKEFDLKTGNWKSYCERLKMYFVANNIVKEEIQLATLISTVGDTTYELMANLVSPKTPSNMTFSEVTKIVGDHLQPKPSIMAERYRFRQRRQHAGEGVAQYIAELKRLARYCEFGPTLEDNMRDQLVCGVVSEIIRQRLFAEEILTYAKAVALSTSLETAEKNAASVDGRVPVADSEPTDMHTVQIPAWQRTRAEMECAVCGARDHVASECKFSSYKCDHCNKVGHLWRMCGRRAGTSERGSSERGAGAARGRARGRRQRRGRGGARFYRDTHFVEGEEDGDREEMDQASSEEEPVYQMSLKNYPAI